MKDLDSFSRVALGVFPTPIQKLENISKLLHRNVYVKRDDLTGLGLGGNKVRKLEFLLADAQKQGAEIVFTTGGAQSNHAMLTAAAAGKLGMKAVLVLKKRGVTECVGNQLLERLMGTDVRFVDTDDYADIYREMAPAPTAPRRTALPCSSSAQSSGKAFSGRRRSWESASSCSPAASRCCGGMCWRPLDR